MVAKYEPCSICEEYIEGIACTKDQCPVAKMKAENERLEKRLEEEKHALFEQQAYTAELQAVIERLQKQLDSKCDRCIARDREKAIKEFAQLVKEHLDDFYHTDDGSLLDTVSMVDLLVKEMTEDQSENK